MFRRLTALRIDAMVSVGQGSREAILSVGEKGREFPLATEVFGPSALSDRSNRLSEIPTEGEASWKLSGRAIRCRAMRTRGAPIVFLSFI